MALCRGLCETLGANLATAQSSRNFLPYKLWLASLVTDCLMDALTSQYNILLEKQQELNNVIPSRLEQLREILLEAKGNLENGTLHSFHSTFCDTLRVNSCTCTCTCHTLEPSNWKESLVMLQQKSKSKNFQKELKEYSSAVSKYGKAIEKVYTLFKPLQ